MSRYTVTDGTPMHAHKLPDEIFYHLRRARHQARIAYIGSAIACALAGVAILVALFS